MAKSKGKPSGGNQPKHSGGKPKGPGGKPSTTGKLSGKRRDNAPTKKGK